MSDKTKFELKDTPILAALKAGMMARKPVVLVGAPGIGKTATMRSIAESMGAELITLIGSQMDPTDITGLPKAAIVAHDDDGEPIWGTEYLMPVWQVKAIRKKRVMLFLDEWSNTPAAVRAGFLTMLQDRVFPNGMKMPDETIIVGAMNPTSDAADGWELDKPTTNRIVFLAWKVTNADWFEGMLKGFGREVSPDEMRWRRLIVKFLTENPTYIHRENDAEGAGTPEAFGVDPNDATDQEILRYAWASRRSWDNLAQILAFVDKNDAFIQDEIAKGTVGAAAATAFRGWLRQQQTYDPNEVLEDPKVVDWKNLGVSDATIICEAIPELINSKNWDKALVFLNTACDNDCSSLVVASVQSILEATMKAAREAGALDAAQARMLEVIKRFEMNKPA